MAGSQQDNLATAENWLARFPMFDGVGGRMANYPPSAAPPALQGSTRRHARRSSRCDRRQARSRQRRPSAAAEALMWYAATDGKGKKDLVVLTYKRRCSVRAISQLVMESLGKPLDLTAAASSMGLPSTATKGPPTARNCSQLRDGVK